MPGANPFFRKKFTYPAKISDDLSLVIYTKISIYTQVFAISINFIYPA